MAESITQERRTAGSADVAAARRVLALEARGLDQLADGIDGAFVRALDVIAAMQGRAVVTGMGKSGHVAHKIAATLASTGTPALFVHPAEAAHGDLGMITARDVVIALSNSGETSELAAVLAHVKRFAIPLVAVTAKPDSTLARTADVVLVLPPAAEACPMGLAPTTSTTMMLALGDALAVALLERNGFSAADFQRLHPGGMLGRRLLRVADIMHAGDEVPLVAADTVMAEALIIMTAKSLGCVGVVDAGRRLIGMVTDGDLRRHMAPDLLNRRVGEVMTAAPTTIVADALAGEALGIMNARKITNLFVVEDGCPVGLVHVHDCLRAGIT
ncbi:MAG: KpsF/GutQ family sugar-phosphate isomerase [Rhodospirillales bacterium]|nr:MAG: KpsF/GutQ family sugar-phosphate isomerase [Rhodospirillales bacterium]